MTHERVLGNAVNVLLPVFRPADFRKRRYSVVDIANSVVYACTGGTSITQACCTLASTPSRRDVQYHVSKIDISWIQSAANRLLQKRVAETLHNRAVDIAIDMTDVPYHGEPENEGDVRRGRARSGTTHFFTYASAYVMLHGRRFTLATRYIREGEALVGVVRYLLAEVQKASIVIKCLFLDKGFFTAAVMSYLNSMRIPYIIAAFPRGRKGGTLSRLTRKRRDSFVVPDCEMTDSATGEKCTFRLYAVAKYRKKRYRKKRGVQYMYYAAGLVNIPVGRMFDEYRRRFGIESSYRAMGKSRARTSSRSPALRFLYVLASLVIQNEWVYIKWQYLSKATRGRYGRRYDAEFTYFHMLLFLRLGLEQKYGAVYSVQIKNSRSVIIDGG
uniref:transposase n=1 Tax=Candidatus Nitrososphaera gargensis TaxID=497727 RepID=UPI0011E4FD36|nr:transposase [Candidatus Nitrososphaera gargensis]